MLNKRILFIINDINFFISHRLPIAIQARKQGFDVHVAASDNSKKTFLFNSNFTFHPIPLSRSGKNPLNELKSILALYRLVNQIKPDILHLVTIKPVLYGGLIARILKVPATVVAISGLGFLFTNQMLAFGLLKRGILKAYAIVFNKANVRFIFQNNEDMSIFIKNGICVKADATLVPGSGVDLSRYKYLPEPKERVVVIMISRLLRDKGVIEYVDAIKVLKDQHVNAKFLLVGDIDYGNPAFIDKKQLDKWLKDDAIEILGFRQDIPELMAAANIIVLPSYREGMPRVLLEAAACGRAVVTTNVPGCNSAVEHNKSGILVPAKNVTLLASAIKKLIENEELRRKMGKEGRLLAERKFSIEEVVSKHMFIYNEVLSKSIEMINQLA